jgi:predicted SpoU family rRNA methylase
LVFAGIVGLADVGLEVCMVVVVVVVEVSELGVLVVVGCKHFVQEDYYKVPYYLAVGQHPHLFLHLDDLLASGKHFDYSSTNNSAHFLANCFQQERTLVHIQKCHIVEVKKSIAD